MSQDKKPKIVYWKRHEWENYLLDETRLIADLINQLPSKTSAKAGKSSKKNLKTVSKEEIDTVLLNYFQKQLKNEFWECLKFNLSRQIKKYPSIEKPDNFSERSHPTHLFKMVGFVPLPTRSDLIFSTLARGNDRIGV